MQRSFRAALSRTVAAAGYRFDAEVTVGMPDGRTVKVRLEGQVDGDRRVLTLSPADGARAVTIRVADGQATVDRGDGPRPIDLDEVPDAPSLELLGGLEELEGARPGTVTGRLPASVVARFVPATGPSPTPPGPARVTVTFRPDGFITGVHLDGPDVSVDTTFQDFQPTGG